MPNHSVLPFLLLLLLAPGCTWQDTAKITTHAAVYTAMIATGNAGDWNMNADLAAQAAEGLVGITFHAANGTNCDSD